MTNQTTARKEISQEEFDKKVTTAMAHYEYFDRLPRPQALAKAQEEVSQEYFAAKVR